MPSSTLDRPRTQTHLPDRAESAEWVVVVPGQRPDDRPDTGAQAAPAVSTPRMRTAVAAPIPRMPRPRLLPEAVRRLLPTLGMVGMFAAVLGLLLGRNPLLTLALTPTHFVAYQGASAEGVRYVLDDGWSQTAAVPGALLMNWSEGRPAPALQLTLGNPTVEPEVAKLAADGTRIEGIRYPGAWPGVDAEIHGQPGGWIGLFIVEPGMNPSVIELEYVGATELKIDPAGRMHVRSADGVWTTGTPESWQDGPSGREPVETRYELRGGGRFGFIVGPYDPSRPLVVDPPAERSS